MMKIFAVCLFAMFACAGAARAGGGGGAEPMPGTNYTDMPPYHPYSPTPSIALRLAGPDGHARIRGPIRRSTIAERCQDL